MASETTAACHSVVIFEKDGGVLFGQASELFFFANFPLPFLFARFVEKIPSFQESLPSPLVDAVLKHPKIVPSCLSTMNRDHLPR